MGDEKYLSDQQIASFLKDGFVVIRDCFTVEQAQWLTKDIWTRLGYEPNNKSTWKEEKINMPSHKKVGVQVFAPKAWRAMCELLGGEERIDEKSATWNDGIIANFGTDYWQGRPYHPSELDNWHVDGDFFRHFLDSREQALLVIPLFSDIAPGGGGTYIATDSIDLVVKQLAAHPEGLLPVPDLYDWTRKVCLPSCSKFHEVTGVIGDVVLMHPLMMHSASHNTTRQVRFITNPPVSLKSPFEFSRADGNYSIVEKKTLLSLGVDTYDYGMVGQREAVVPERLRRQAKMLEEENMRLGRQSQAVQ